MRLFRIGYCESGSIILDINPRRKKDSSHRCLLPLVLPPQDDGSLLSGVTTSCLLR